MGIREDTDRTPCETRTRALVTRPVWFASATIDLWHGEIPSSSSLNKIRLNIYIP
ncbi:Protein of unknown function [Pyronema omphalodes CBS 100304]|uniref:Uncharacterized protein n=1 Tax=Pyronema omphalodes (strain CBS 100304) TaxID=1076935 RepID=U4L8A8_PYROM|nr:Protein of unknown function [Pyronema omphalodes CBS 100304]